MKVRIAWTDGEIDKLAEQLETMLQNSPGESLHKLSNRAMLSWPEDRRRAIATDSDSSMRRIKKILVERMLKARERLRKLETCAAGHAQAPQKTNGHAASEEAPGYGAQLESIPLSELAGRAAARAVGLAEQLLKTVKRSEQMLGEVLGILKNPKVQEKIAREKLPHYAVIGLLGDQRAKLLDALGKRIKFHFYDGDAMSGTNLVDADLYFLMTNFIRHGWANIIVDRAKIRTIKGGMTTLVEAIEKELVGVSS